MLCVFCMQNSLFIELHVPQKPVNFYLEKEKL